ncbi:tandem-95 repeat protein [Legionella moravica]|uniref:tandem-95 repeat protein n=1 Tax=Legionella moravica TaxID=39962 RepID=UPI003BF881E0
MDGPVRVTQFSVTGDLTVYNAGDTATITGIGTLRIDANGDFSFIPAANYNGAVPVVTYTMSDGSSTDTSTLSIDVTPVDDAFSDANEVVSTAEDTTLNGSVLTGTSSVDGPVSVTQFSVAGDVTVYNAGNTATIAGVGILRIDANGTFSFIPAANYNGAVPVVTYTLSDGSSSDTSTLNIDVTPVDDAFSDANEVLSTAEDTTLNGNVLTGTSSVDGPVSVAQFTVAGDVTVYNAGDTASIAGIGTVRIDFNGAFSFIPAANYYGAVPVVTYIMSDGSSSDTSTLSISVTPVDDAFSDANEVLSMAEDTALNGSVLTGTSSVDGPVSVTQFSVAGDVTVYNAGNTATIAGVGTLRIDANGDFSFIPLANYNGAVPVATYTLSDGSSSDTSTLSISVTPVDDAFSDANEVLSTAEDTILNGSVLTGTSSVDGPVSVTQFIVAGDPATYNAGDTATIVGIGTLRIDANGAFSFIPATNYNGAVPLTTYTLTDGSSSDVSTLSINVTPVNDSPVNGLRLTQTMNEDGSRAFNVTNSNAFSVTDVDSSTVTTTLSVLHGILTASSSAATAQGVTLTNNGTSSITLVGAPDKITLVLDGLVYKPTADYDVSDTLTMTSTDGTLTDTDLMTINITSIADITDDTASTNEDTAVVINVLANDSFENPGRTITAINGLDIVSGGTVSVSNGTVLLNANGTLTFTPVANYNGNTSFTYTVTSGGATETATVNLTVNSVNDAPQGADYLLTINNTNPVVLTTSYFSMTDVNDSPANALLNVRISTLPASGTLALNGVAVTAGQNISAVDIAAGLLVYTPVSNFSGSTSFTFQVRDDGGTANGGVNLDQSPNSFTFNLPVVADTPVIYAHIGLPTITGGTSFIAANFSNDLDENSLSNWSSVALFSNTFAEVQGGNGKLQTEASLFNSTAWAGQTGTDATEVSNFNSRWVKSGGLMTYNNGNVNDDAQGILLLNSNQMTVEERALTSYLITVGMYADASASQANGVGFVFGYQDSSNYFLLRWENPNTVYAPGGAAFESAPGQYLELSLVQVVAGTAIDLARTTFNGDDFFNVSINVSPNGISVSAADVNNSSATANLEYVYGSISGGTSTAPALNSIGLYTFDNDSLVQWDNIVIKQPVSFQYILQTEAYLTDTDGSETLSNITLSSIPAGATLFDTVTNTAVTVTGGSATVVAGNDIRLTTTTALTTAQINAITAAVTATETSNGSTSTQTTPVLFEVLGNSPAETISGSASGEWITGEAGNDVLNARGGADVIIGGLGNDTITTGGGSDQIVLLKGQGGATAGAAPIDTITDFTVNTDTIVIKGSNIIGVSVSIPTSYTYTITVNYSGGAATEYFKVTLSNGAMLNDSGDNQLTGVVISGGTATIDGTIVGAILYLDINGNNQEDEGERLGITDQYGHVEWVLDLAKLDVNGDGQYVLGEARAVQTGGFDVDTGLSYDINLFGPVGSAIISPLTSLLQAQLESGFDYQTANANIVARLGLPEGTELINLNPILGANEILAQNASVMTAAVQFAELAAIRYSTDEGRVSFSVFDAISKALLELPERTIADFSDKAFLQDIALHLDLGDLASPEVIEFMAASQQALQVSMGALAPGESALAAISEVQYLTQGSYAQILEHYMNGYLPAYLLSDISVIINAFSSSSITYEELKDFNNQFNTVVNQEINSSSGISTDGSADYYSYDFIHNAESLINTFMTTHDLPVSSSQEYQIYTLSDLGLVDDYVLFYDANTQENTSTPSPSMGGVELHGSSGSESIYGTEGNDLIFGGEGDDHLYGGQGDDTILGGLGNDVIYGGMGNDHMTGGGGNDIFVFEKADIGDKPVIDTITDFKLGTDGDAGGDKSTLDLSDLFKDSTLSSESLDTLLQISTVHNESTNQTDTVIKTDLTGNAQFNASPETIVLSGVDVVSAYGTSDSAELINHLLAANILVMGH